ncbi:helix-turn-helix domain-containing protein [Clostridium sp.]|uniref:helix-turn-helix domain-containing protein n=1 Tax=Clostridium sp. TaxID=1506 RepID=UPI0032169DF7
MGYTRISNDIIEMSNISNGAFRLNIILQKMCFGDKNKCFPSQSYLAKALNKSVRTVQRYIDELIKAKVIVKKRRGSISNIYTVMDKVCTSCHGIVDNSYKNSEVHEEKSEIHEKNSVESKNEEVSVEGDLEAIINRRNYDDGKKRKNMRTGFSSNYKNNYNKVKYSNEKNSQFNGYEQRSYDMERLENMLLGHEVYDSNVL